jgi:hypothetical protein
MQKIPLGVLVEDKVTGFTGVTDHYVTFLHGCDRYSVQPRIDKDGKKPESDMFDEPQLRVLEGDPVMEPAGIPPELVKLGQVVKDPVRGLEGTVVGRAVYLNGCSRICVTPKQKGDKDLTFWIDENQVEPKKTMTGGDKTTVKPGAKKTGGPAPYCSKR